LINQLINQIVIPNRVNVNTDARNLSQIQDIHIIF